MMRTVYNDHKDLLIHIFLLSKVNISQAMVVREMKMDTTGLQGGLMTLLMFQVID